MSLTNEQEREYIAQLEPLSNTQVRADLDHGRIPPALVHSVSVWLSARERASLSEQIETARRASDAAERAALAADRAAIAAERQATAAERANTKANIALIIAIASTITMAVITFVGIMISHLDVHK